MDKMWASFLKDGDVLSGDAELFIKCSCKRSSCRNRVTAADHLPGFIFQN